MRKQILILSSLLLALILVVGITNCKKSTSSTTTFSLSTLKAGTIDLNGAIPPTNVPTSPTITAVFTLAVNATTATTSTISLVQGYDTANIAITIAVTGAKITITPTTPPLAGGALYSLKFKAGILSTDGQAIGAFTRSFTTIGTFVPSGAVAYWNFETAPYNDQIGTYPSIVPSVVTDITLAASRNAAAGQCAAFNGSTSLIEVPNGQLLMNTSDFSISFWIKEDSAGRKDQFTMGLAAWYGFQFEINNNGNSGLGECKLAAQYSLSDGTSASQDLWFNGADTNSWNGNGGWQGWTYAKDLTSHGGTGVNGLLAEKWADVVCTYDHATKIGTMYINGEKMKQQDFNLYGTTHPLYKATGLKFAGNADNNAFVFGFIQDKVDPTVTDSWADYNITTNNHFKGWLDDVRIFHKVLTPNEILLMYNSEKP
ncbi:MAG: LamG-like jellyroll fold domain-containing protein [Bacteroidales bacterium]